MISGQDPKRKFDVRISILLIRILLNVPSLNQRELLTLVEAQSRIRTAHLLPIEMHF